VHTYDQDKILMIQTIIACVLGASFFVVEPFMRKGANAKTIKTTASDKGSSNLIIVMFWIDIILPPLLNFFHVGQIASSMVTWLGVLMMVISLGLRFWSMRVLGEYYTRTLRVTDTQAIVMQGPYRVIRHPGYLGTICVWIGFALAVGNWIATIILAILLFGVYGYRIRSEETMLIDKFGEVYQDYKKRTWRLMPFVY
jgi:protein-S-isoprenylcysteine O-methyltransferase Ste14